jgi:hypothetical protein
MKLEARRKNKKESPLKRADDVISRCILSEDVIIKRIDFYICRNNAKKSRSRNIMSNDKLLSSQ